MNNPTDLKALEALSRNSRSLAKSIFQADVPEQYIKTLPAQTLFCVLQTNGLESSADLIEMTTPEQCQLLLDFDIWSKDTLNEEKLWAWLGVTDVTNDLELLQIIYKNLDLKIVALLISRYVKHVVFEEPTDLPPGDNYHTPDKGSTWIAIENLDGHKEFLLKRLLALIFETNADLFYQLLAIPSIATDSGLEEEAYQDRNRRVSAEGVPDMELAGAIYAKYYIDDLKKDLGKSTVRPKLVDIRVVDPLIYDTGIETPLEEFLRVVGDRESCEAELTYLLNASIVRWGIDFSDLDEVKDLLQKVKGALTLGLDMIKTEGYQDLQKIYQLVGLQKILRLGYTKLLELHGHALKLTTEQLKAVHDSDDILFRQIAFLREPFPCLPSESTSPEQKKPEIRALSSLSEYRVLSDKISALQE